MRSSSVMFFNTCFDFFPHKYQHLVNSSAFFSSTNKLVCSNQSRTDLCVWFKSSHSGRLLPFPHDHHVFVTEGHQKVQLRVHCYTVDGGALNVAEALSHRARPLQHLPKQRTRQRLSAVQRYERRSFIGYSMKCCEWKEKNASQYEFLLKSINSLYLLKYFWSNHLFSFVLILSDLTQIQIMAATLSICEEQNK